MCTSPWAYNSKSVFLLLCLVHFQIQCVVKKSSQNVFMSFHILGNKGIMSKVFFYLYSCH